MSSTGTPPKRTTKKQKRKCDTLGRTTEVTDISKTTAAEYIRRLFSLAVIGGTDIPACATLKIRSRGLRATRPQSYHKKVESPSLH